MGFQFPLQRLLDYKENIEEKKKEKLAALQNEQNILSEELLDTQNKYKRCTCINPDAKVNLSLFGQQLAYMEHLDVCIGEQKAAVQQASLNVEECRKEVVEAMRDRQVIEKLKAKQETAYYNEMNNREQMELNEIAISRYFRASVVSS